MKGMLYPKLAWQGIRKNRRMVLPYILTGAVMVAMYYILAFLSELPALRSMKGGEVLQTVLPLGCGVIALFSLLFLFYTHSFLIRQRTREFGLYHILGMDKRNLGKIIALESLFTAVCAIGAGLIGGLALSKAAELVLFNMLKVPVSYTLHLGSRALCQTPLVYGGIYLLLLLHALFWVRHTDPLDLMKSSRMGERIPRRVWPGAGIGLLLLGTAYGLAVSIQEPLTAFTAFFIAVLLVIAGTYLLFMSGSVVLCRLLQKNKRYYYRPNHFVSVSSMAYRMRRNGAGLASICILITMVLVMLSSTASLYTGIEDMLNTRYPHSVNIQTVFEHADGIGEENLDRLRESLRQSGGTDDALTGTHCGELPGLFTEQGITVNYEESSGLSLLSYEKIGYLSVISLADYNGRTGQKQTLSEEECLLDSGRLSMNWDTFAIGDGRAYRVKGQFSDWEPESGSNPTLPVVTMVVADLSAFAKPLEALHSRTGDPLLLFTWECGFDTDTPQQESAAVEAVQAALQKEALFSCQVEGREENRADYFKLSASLLFLGAVLSVVFLLAAVLIIYYKQLSEGYEDASRFAVMQKVGMTKKDIRKSINSQMLTVFFSPLIFAGVHLCFAFPFIWKILKMFALHNLPLLLTVTAVCFALFGLLYAAVYKITANAYYAIVSGKER